MTFLEDLTKQLTHKLNSMLRCQIVDDVQWEAIKQSEKYHRLTERIRLGHTVYPIRRAH